MTEINLSRRSFLGGALSVAVIASVPAGISASPEIPRIYGNGRHDDAPGLQALIDGKPFICENDIVFSAGNDVYIVGGYFLLSKDLHFGRKGSKNVTMHSPFIEGANLIFHPGPRQPIHRPFEEAYSL